MNTLVTGLKERIEQLENHSEGFHITENILPEQNSRHNEKRNNSEMDVTTTSDTNDEPTHLTSKIECDVLILGDSILRRIQPKRFTPQGKTIVRFIRGGAKTCTNFVEKNGQRYNAKNILINIGTRDLQGEGVKEDEFSHLLDSCTKTWENSIIYLLPIIPRLDIDNYIVNRANNSINLVCDLYPGVIKIERFQPTNDMFHDDVHLNYRNGLPAIV